MDEDGYFGEQVAATYDDPDSEMFSPAAVDAVADVLAELAGGGRALELGIQYRAHRAAAGAPRGPGPRHRPVAGDGRPAARQARR
jgi:hypothetical protein